MLNFLTKGDFRGIEIQTHKEHPTLVLFFVLFLKIVVFPRAPSSQGVQDQERCLPEATS